MQRISQYPLGASAVPLLSESGRGRQQHSSLCSSALMMIGACVGSSEFTPMQQLHQPEASSMEMMLRRELLERQIAVEQQRQLLEQYLLTLSSSSGILPSGLTLMQQTNTSQHLAPVSSLAGHGGSPGMMQTYLQLQQQRQMALIPNTGSTEMLHSSDNDSRLQPKPTAADSLHYSAYPRKTIRQHRNVIPLSLPSDFDQLSSYQVLVRQQMELFVANREDVTTSVQGRKQAVTLGQVGIRCRHCTNLPLRQRGRGSAYYPKKLQGVYQAVQNMSLTHLQLTCSCIPLRIREQLAVLHQRSEKTVGGKAYWVEACQTLGVMEDEANGLHFAEEKDHTNHPDTK